MMRFVDTEYAKTIDRTDDDFVESFCWLELSSDQGDTARCVVAASMFAIWRPKEPGEHRPKHKFDSKDPWGAGLNTRMAFIHALLYVRSRLGLWTDKDDVVSFIDRERIQAYYDPNHFNGLIDGDRNYRPSEWIEVDSKSVKMSKVGLQEYESRHKEIFHLGCGFSNSNGISTDDKENAAKITEQTAICKVRMYQNQFRTALITVSNSCSISGISELNLLIACHIRPWRGFADHRLDTRNGLLMYEGYHRLFDNFYFSIDESGAILVADWINKCSERTQQILEEIRGKTITRAIETIDPVSLQWHNRQFNEKQIEQR